jgi:nucleotide-binding universal stress UspA family protein
METDDRPVVVGVDGSPSSLQAVDWAVEEAGLRHRALRVLCAYGWPWNDLPLDVEPMMATRSTRQAAERVVAEAVDRARELAVKLAPELDITTELSADMPAAALIEASRQAAVVVVGSRGLGGFEGLLAGSVSTQLASHAHSPVVVTRAPAHPDGPIVVGVDGSAHSTAALGFAFEEAALRRAALLAVYAWRGPSPSEPDDALPRGYDGSEVSAEAHRVLADAIAGWHEKFPDVPVERRVSPGRAGAVLTEASAQARLLVVGSRGLGEVTGLLLGSVSHHVLHHAASPVAIVRPR